MTRAEARELARINRALRTTKQTPGHVWCRRCGANKPPHRHPRAVTP